MERLPRRIEDCPFRQPPEANGIESARCGLLAELMDANDASFSRVGNDACEACCKSFPPSVRNLNPVVASLLYQAASQIVKLGGVAGCGRQRSEELIRLAVANLPSDEDLQNRSPGDVGRSTWSESRSFEQLIPRPKHRSGSAIRTWAVGVTTAPREAPTLTECLTSLTGAGWPVPRLFIDGPVPIPDEFAELPRTNREPRVGAWPNYYLALGELLMREPEADAYLIVQDDTLFSDIPGLKDYLERVLWPGRQPGVASLFCSRADTQPQAGWYRIEGVWVWCALAFIFSRDAAQRFLADRDVVLHRWSRSRNGLADISWRVGKWAHSNDVPIYFPTPSLVQHIGDVSALWEGVRAFGNRRAAWFAGHEPAAQTGPK